MPRIGVHCRLTDALFLAISVLGASTAHCNNETKKPDTVPGQFSSSSSSNEMASHAVVNEPSNGNDREETALPSETATYAPAFLDNLGGLLSPLQLNQIKEEHPIIFYAGKGLLYAAAGYAGLEVLKVAVPVIVTLGAVAFLFLFALMTLVFVMNVLEGKIPASQLLMMAAFPARRP